MPLFGEPGAQIGYTVYPHAAGGPPLLLLHGFTASPASFGANIPELNERFTVVTVELLGHGQSDAPADPAPYAPEPAVGRILGLMDELGYERVLLCGHSLGGALAVRVALAAPERVAGLVILNSNSAAGTPEWREEVQPQLQEMAARLRAEGTAFLRQTRLYPARSQRLPEEWRQALTRDFDRLRPEGVAGTAEGLVARVNCFERLSELTIPTLVVVGDRDPEFVHNAPRLVANLRRNIVQMVTIQGGGHAANLEQPEVFDQALVRFAEDIGYLAEPGGGGGHRMLYVLAGGVLAIAAAAIVLALFAIGGSNGDSRAVVLPSRTATRISEVAAAKATPTPTAVVAASTLATTATQAASPSPTATAAESPTSAPTTAPAATPRAATPTPRPATPAPTDEPPTATPVPDTPTPAPTPTATATATSTPSGPGVSVTGPTQCTDAPNCYVFAVALNGSPDYQVIRWTGTGGAQIGPTYRVLYGGSCITASVTVTYYDGTRYSDTRTFCP